MESLETERRENSSNVLEDNSLLRCPIDIHRQEEAEQMEQAEMSFVSIITIKCVV